MAHRRNGRTAKNYSLLLGSGRVRLAPLYDVASILPYDQCDLLKAKLAMKIGDEYKLSDTGLRQWQKCARELREDPDELVEMLTQMAKQLPDEVNAARTRALDEGLDEAFVESLAVQVIARAHECERRLAEAK